MQLHLTIDLRAVIIGFVLLLVAAAVATPFAISLADDGPGGDRSSEQRAVLGTAFTYQGRLDTGSGPANGNHDFQFRMFDDLLATIPTAGLPPAGISRTALVTNGLFTVDIDFGATPFDGNARFIEVRVKPTGAPGGFALMDPLQPLTMQPQAIFAMKAGTALTAGSAITATTAQTATIALTANSVQWTDVANKPPTFADNLDNDTLTSLSCTDGKIAKFQVGTWACADDIVGPTYTAGAGLTLTSAQFSVQFLTAGAVNGSVNTAARTDHTHRLQKWTSSGVSASTYGLEVEGNIGGIQGRSTGGNPGVYGQGTNTHGIYGTTTSPTGAGVYGQSNSYYGVGGSSNSSYGLHGLSQSSDGVVGTGGSGFAGIVGFSRNGANTQWGGYFVGNLGVEGTGPWTSSDVRLKRNIAPVASALNAVERLRPVTFAWENSTDGSQHMGFLAQDVQKVLPELVIEGRNGMLMLQYNGIIPVLTRAIQEQQAQIEALRSASEPRPSGGLDTAPIVEAPAPAAPVTTIIRQAVGPSSSAVYAGAGALLVFALALVGHGAIVRRRPS